VVEYPSRETLTELAARPVEPFDAEATKRVVDWQFSSVEQTAASFDWSPVLLEAVRDRSDVKVVPELGCAAHELARFRLEHGAFPDARLRRFMVGACGASAPGVSAAHFSFDVDDGVTDAQIYEQSGRHLAAELRKALPEGRLVSGFSIARAGGKVAAILVHAPYTAELTSLPVANARRRVILEGTVAGSISYFGAYVNRGAFGYAPCERDFRVKLPAFRIRCELAEEDETAWIELFRVEEGKLLGQTVAMVLARARADAVVRYRAADAPGVVVKRPLEARDRIIAGINAARARAGRPTLALAEQQSATNDQLAPLFFRAMGDPDTADTIALGLIAGWEVNGMIRSSSLYAASDGGVADAERFLATVLDGPFARRVLLDPEASQVAVGAVLGAGGTGLGTVITTYQFFHAGSDAAAQKTLLQRIAEERSGRGLPRLHINEDVSALRRAVQTVRNGGSPEGAMERLARDAGRSGQGRMAYVFQLLDIEHVPLPELFLRQGSYHVALAVTHYRPPGAAWGQFVVFALSNQ
jgi:hypothetical protein